MTAQKTSPLEVATNSNVAKICSLYVVHERGENLKYTLQ